MAEIEKQISDLERSIAQKQERLKDLNQKQKQIARSNETRRKIILGAAFLAGLKHRTPEDQDRSLRWLYRHVTNKRDREFLGLAPLAEPPMRKQ
ncbi:hypothetical protein [Acidimangrovimonas pyrenivorans]|uniref:Mobilization protein n=1 Tax=Acidimangrovimonas pyrenivorans TaxID=2030798 RepID=A0ABV7AD06_9RHOB